MLSLFPAGFEEREDGHELELAAYGQAVAAKPLFRAFGSVASEPVEPGWEERWKDFHRAVRVGPLWVGPPWERPDAGLVPVVVDPGRAFGTGAHPTTRLCLELLVELERGSLLDLGCGSGVLAVAAAKLGFAPVLALDSDGTAVEATCANAAANEAAVDARRADVLAERLPETDAAVANIALPVVERLGERVPARTLVASGYLADEEPALPAWRRLDRREAEGWAADLLERREE